MANKTGKVTTAKAAKAAKPARGQTPKTAVKPVQRSTLPSVWKLTRAAAVLLWQHKKVLIGITFVYGLLNLLLVRGLASTTDVGGLKDLLNQASHGNFSSLASSVSIFVVLLGSAGNNSSGTAGSYQFFLAVMISLAIIWALRQLVAGNTIRIRDAYYRGMYPLIPFILVLGVVALQLLPAIIGSALYSAVINNGIAVLFIEKFLWALLLGLSLLLTLYLLSSSLLALYIVTLPDMAPLQALRSARQLVHRRRWAVMRKIVCLPIVLVLVAAIIMLPIILLLTGLAQWVFFVLTVFTLTATHTYMYNLYRELL